MAFYLKHREHGNRHVATLAECEALQAAGWVRWPRTKTQKEWRPPPAHASTATAPAETVEVVSGSLGSAVKNTLKLRR